MENGQENGVIQVVDGKLSLYKVHMSDMTFDATNVNQSMVKVENNGAIYLEDVVISNNTSTSDKAFIDMSDDTSKLYVASASFIGNTLDGENARLAQVAYGNNNIIRCANNL